LLIPAAAVDDFLNVISSSSVATFARRGDVARRSGSSDRLPGDGSPQVASLMLSDFLEQCYAATPAQWKDIAA